MVYRYSKPPSQRQLRVAESIRHGLSEVFMRNEMAVPALDKIFITVSEVRISPDLKLATAFVSSVNTQNIDELIEFLNEKAPLIRKLLAPKVALKYMPEVRFALDKSFEEGAHIDELLHKARKPD